MRHFDDTLRLDLNLGSFGEDSSRSEDMFEWRRNFVSDKVMHGGFGVSAAVEDMRAPLIDFLVANTGSEASEF